MAKRRRRGVVLTPEGLQKFQDARLKSEADNNYGERYTYEKLSDITYLDIHTIKRVIECQEGVDKRTIERLFISFEIELTDSCFTKPNPHKRQNWGEAMCVDTFYGRTEELTILESWLLKDRCRIINILAMGGMGKTCLSVKLAKQIQNRFDLVMWCSLRDAPPVDEFVSGIIEFFSDGKETTLDLPDGLKGKITKLIEYLRNLRCLLVLDNMESLLCEGKRAGEFREGHEGYEDLLRRLGDTNHQSSVIITTREKPKQIAVMEGEELPVRTFRLHGLAEDAGEQVLKIKGLTGSESAYRSLVHHYGGNALALKVVAATIRDLFQGDIHDFLEHETAVFGDIRDLLKQQFDRLTDVEREIVYWLAINREPLSIEDIRADIVSTVPKLKLLGGLESLSRRSLVERDDSCFGLQNVVMEYVICRFIERVSEEIISLELKLFRYHAVIKATAKDYIRETQIRLIMEPIIEELMAFFKSKRNVEKRLNKILTVLRETFSSESCYAGGNVLNMLCHIGADFTGYDFSGLTVWQADFRHSCFHDVDFSHSDLSKSVFAEAFGGIWSVAFSPDGKILATGDTKGEIILRRVSDGQPIQSFKGHNGWVVSLDFSPDGNTLASSSCDCTAKLWNVNNGQCLHTLREHEHEVWSIAFSPDGNTLASGCDDNKVRLWQVSTGKCFKVFQGHTNSVLSIDFDRGGQKLLSGGDDKIIRLWDIETGECLKVFLGHSNMINSVAFSSQGNLLASGSYDQKVKLWNISTYECLKTFQGYSNQALSVIFSPSGQTVAGGGHDQKVRLWDTNTGKILRTFDEHSNWVWSVAFNPQGNLLASGSGDKIIKLWDVKTGKAIKIFQGHHAVVRSVAFSSDNQTLASGSEDQTARLWDINTGQTIKIFQGHQAEIWSIAFSPDGQLLASSSLDGTAKLWNIETGDCLKTLKGHTNWVWSIAFSPDNQTIATTSPDQTIRLWNISTGECKKIIKENRGYSQLVSFSKDSQIIASCNQNHDIKFWKVSTGECFKVLKGHRALINSIAFSSDNYTLVSSSEDETIKLWNIKSGECIKSLEVKKPYENMNFIGITGLTEANLDSLKALGAVSTLSNKRSQVEVISR